MNRYRGLIKWLKYRLKLKDIEVKLTHMFYMWKLEGGWAEVQV